MASIYLFEKLVNSEKVQTLFAEHKVVKTITTGHSLGGAIATLTALFLRFAFNFRFSLFLSF